jgi:predicted helicase
MAKIFHASLHGLLNTKDQTLLASDIGKTEWSNIDIETSSFYLLIPQNSDLRREYDKWWKITDIFPVNSVGIVTGQDALTIATEKIDAEILATKHNLSVCSVKPILYRPFDLRYIVYDSNVVTRPRSKVMNHMLVGDNLAMSVSRSVRGEPWRDAQVTTHMVEFGVMATRPGNSAPLFPLYLYPTTQAEITMGITRKPNISNEFLTEIELFLGYTPTPEAIFSYVYAILYSSNYRSRYAELLQIDFPHIPLTRNVNLFRQLSELGEQLVNSHLMKSLIPNKESSPFINNGGGCIVDAGHPKYENGKVVINKQKDGFMDVPEAVWNFHVGGYQVCHKWLKDRKGRALSQDDISHYQKIVVALGQSIKLMKQIDEAIPSWPMDSEYN